MRKKLKPLKHQRMVLLGASSGMGRATALAAAKKGARLVVAARNRAALDSLVQEIEGLGGEALAVEVDASDFQQVQTLAEKAVEKFGGFDTWVNFAATAIYAPFSDLTPEEFRRVIDVNLIGQANGAMVALRQLRAQGSGALIFISSVEGEVAMPYHSAYAASKHGINGLFDALHLELRHAGSPVSVTNIMPTGVNTPFFSNAKTKIGVKPKPPQPIYQPEHVAQAVLFAAENPVRELYVGGGAKLMVASKRFFPRLTQSYLLSAAFRAQRTREPKSADAPSGLYAPETGDQRVHGDFDAVSKPVSCYTWLQTHPAIHRLVKAAVLLVGIGWLADRLHLLDEAEDRAHRALDRWF